jgi:hypothetical protein
MVRESARGPKLFSAAELGLVTLLFALLTVILAYPLSLHPEKLRVDMGVDGDLGWYILSWDTHAFLHHPWAIFDANIYYPDRYTLAYGENIIGLAFFAAPVIWLTGNAALATTLVSLLSCVLCGLGAYVLARRVGLTIAAAVVCGIIFECAPPRFFRIGQITLTNIQWIPFALASAQAYFDHGRKRDLRLTAAFVTLQVLSSGHGAVFVTLSLLLFGLYRLVLGEPVQPLKRIRDLGVPGLLLLLPSVLIFLPYRYVQNVMGLRRGLGSWDTEFTWFLASPSYVDRWIYKLLGATNVLSSEVTLFPGFLALFLAAVALVWQGSRDAGTADDGAARVGRRMGFAVRATAIVSAVVAALLTLGRVFELRIGHVWIDWPAPTRVLWVLFAASMIAALALRRYAPDGTFARSARLLVVTGACMLVFVPIALVRPTLGAGDGLRGEYFTNAAWAGTPQLSAVDPTLSPAWIDRRWQGERPDQFSVRWTGFLSVPRAGTYTLSTMSDDGSQVFVDGISAPVVDNGGSHSPQKRSGQIGLAAGPHAIEIRYMQTGGDIAFNLSWARNGGTESTVPTWALSQGRPPASRVLAARVLDWAEALLALVAACAAVWAFVAWWRGPSGAVVAAWAARSRVRARPFYVIFTVLTLGLALGPPHGLWQYVYWMPGFNFIRASSRFSLLALLGLAVLAGMGFDALTKSWSSTRRNRLAAVFAVVLLAEYFAVPMGFTETHYEIPAIDRWLDTRPKPFVVAEVPARSEQDQVDYMNHSTAHWQKTVQGYDGWRRDFHAELYETMQRFPDEESLTRLEQIGITYVVVHQERYEPAEWARVEAGLERYASRLRLEHVEGAGRVYAVVKSRSAAPGAGPSTPAAPPSRPGDE